MQHASNKEDVLTAIHSERKVLEELIAPLSPEQMTAPGALGEWSVKDVLAHLVEWEQMFLGWYNAGLRGEKPALPAEGYNWRQLNELNHVIYLKHKDRPLAEVLEDFAASYQQILEVVEKLDEEDMFGMGRFAWCGKLALEAYIAGNTSRHYAWACKYMRVGRRKRKNPKDL
jgi:uncharacterized protein (TIGR03083 family)